MLKNRSRPRREHRWPALLGSALCLMTSAGICDAHAATTYRCELPGEVRYQHQACPGGRAVKTSDRRTAAQHQDTAKATETTAKLAKQLERDRRRQDKASKGQKPIAMDAPTRQPGWPPAPNSTQGPTLKKQPRPFTAKVPKDPGKQTAASI